MMVLVGLVDSERVIAPWRGFVRACALSCSMGSDLMGRWCVPFTWIWRGEVLLKKYLEFGLIQWISSGTVKS